MALFRCTECGWRGDEGLIIRFADPLRDGNSWNICPQCRAAESFENMCDEPGCERAASCGWPDDPDGYRRTCGEHWRK
jgi:hypothetical protein